MTLAAREQRVLELLADGRSYDQVARTFNVPEDRIRQIERSAREKLSAPLPDLPRAGWWPGRDDDA